MPREQPWRSLNTGRCNHSGKRTVEIGAVGEVAVVAGRDPEHSEPEEPEAQGQVDQTEVRHVLIKSSEIRSPDEARDLALTLREEVVGGSRPFEQVAKLYSDDPGSALSGGSLGWSQQGAFVPEFESLVHTSDVGVVSEVFQTVHGYHFLEVTGRRVEDFSDEYKRRQAERFLLNQRFDEELDSWLREIREDAFVEMRGEEDEDTQET